MDQATFDAARNKGKRQSETAHDKWQRLVAASSKGSLTWLDADADLLKAAVAAVTEDGAALLLAKTSDGGALVLKVINNKSSTPLYPASTQSLRSTLELIAQIAETP